jgi:hypothetical protein
VTVATLVQGWTRATQRIDERAKKISPRQVALLVLMIVPFTVAFLIYFAWKTVWTAITWLGAACVEGWESGKALEAKRAAVKRGESWTS